MFHTNYDLPLIPISAFNFSTDDDYARSFWQSGQGHSWAQPNPPSFHYDPGSVQIVRVWDNENRLDDDDRSKQQLAEAVQLNGRTWPRGHRIENEYMITVRDEDGNEYHLAAVSINKLGEQKDPIVGFSFDTSQGAGWPPAGTELFYVPGSHRDVTSMPYPEKGSYPCFTRGTLIETAAGPRPIEELAEGELIVTRDNGLQKLRWIGSVNLSATALELNEKLRPIRIRAGALGDGVPARDLLVSPQHRMLVRSRIAQRMFGTSEVLVAAKQLLMIEGVEIAQDADGVEYFHMLFDRHEVVIANGAESESLFTGTEALKMVGEAAREEIFTLFPELRQPDFVPASARPLISGRQGRKMAVRHMQNGRALVN